MKTKNTQIFATFILSVLLALIAVGSMLLFQRRVTKLAEAQAYQTLTGSAKEQMATLNEIFSGRFSVLESFANSLANQKTELTLEDVTIRMNAITQVCDFDNLAVAGADGVAYTSDGLREDSSDRFYMTEALSGRRAIQNLTDSRLYQKNRMVLSVPVYLDGKVAGAVMGSFSEEEVKKLLVSSAFDGVAYSFLSDSAGEIVVSAEAPLLMQETGNLFDKFANMQL